MKNGEWREAHGTRNSECIESVDGELPKGTGPEKEGIISYWDLNANGWRSCREDSIIAINKVYTIEEYNQNV